MVGAFEAGIGVALWCRRVANGCSRQNIALVHSGFRECDFLTEPSEVLDDAGGHLASERVPRVS